MRSDTSRRFFITTNVGTHPCSFVLGLGDRYIDENGRFPKTTIFYGPSGYWKKKRTSVTPERSSKVFLVQHSYILKSRAHSLREIWDNLTKKNETDRKIVRFRKLMKQIFQQINETDFRISREIIGFRSDWEVNEVEIDDHGIFRECPLVRWNLRFKKLKNRCRTRS